MSTEQTTPLGAELDPVTFEVIRHRLWAINDDQARMAARLSGAAIVFEGYDFNTALVTRDGRGLYCGIYIMQHGATIDGFVRRVLDEWPTDDIREGDMFFTNDPWNGALHAPDAILVMPVFWQSELVAWSGIVMHDNDEGGAAPGSMVLQADDRFAESPLFPMIKMVEDFEIRHDMEQLYLRNSRSPELNRLNLRARLGALRVTHGRIGQIVDRYGLDAFLAAQDGIVDYVDRVVRQRLRTIPDGTWFAEGYLDHDGKTDAVYPIRCGLTKRDDQLTFDFTGTARQAPGAVNCTLPATEGSVYGVIVTALCYDLPWAIGGLQGLTTIISEPGTINNALSPAPVSAASVAAVLVTSDVVNHAFAKMLLSTTDYRDEAHANWMPSFSGGFFTSLAEHQELGLVALADMFAGGGGARRHSDGIDTGGIAHSMASRMCNVETIESRAPVLQVYRREVRDGGGPGQYRGGVALEFAGMAHKTPAPGLFMTFASGVALPGGRGLSGGFPGAASSSVMLRGSDARAQFARGTVPVARAEVVAQASEILPAKSTAIMGPDDVLVTIVGSGSGYGDPLLRDPAAVARDVADGLVSDGCAAEVYGVDLAGGAVDEAGTTLRRDGLRRARVAQLGADTIAEATVRHPVTDAVEAVETAAGQARFRCTSCHADLGAYDGDYKRAARLHELSLPSISPVNAFCSEDFVARQFCCPGCGASLVVDVQRRDEPISSEVLFGSAAPAASINATDDQETGP